MIDWTWTAPTVVAVAWLIGLAALLWIWNPRHERTRAILRPALMTLVGLAVRIGLID